jgi:hypothetical protein
VPHAVSDATTTAASAVLTIRRRNGMGSPREV